MDTRAIFLLGFLIGTTYGFIPSFIRRDEVQPPAEMSQESRGGMERMEKAMNCLFHAFACPPIGTMMDSMFKAKYGKLFIVNNELTFSCSAETKANFEECADNLRSTCVGHTNWVNGFAGLYKDFCAMKPDLQTYEACMNSVTVSEKMENCTSAARDLRSVCRTMLPCIQSALDSEPRCEPQFITKLMEAMTSLRNTQFYFCERMGLSG